MKGSAPVVAVLGAGSWGTALAMQLARNGNSVRLWARNSLQIAEMQKTGRNARFFPDIDLPAGIEPETSLETAVQSSTEVLVAVPSHAFASTLESIRSCMEEGRGVSWACKGFEPGTGRFLHQVADELLVGRHPTAVVTGPSFAHEVARSMPTALTVASEDEAYSERMATLLHGLSFRAYTSSDMIGAELGGAVKNVMAIATGICDGMGLGDNARAALITRGLAELMRLGGALGARSETLMGLAGVGDLVLTCTGDLSRNRGLGLAMGRGSSLEEAVEEIGQVVEGVKAAVEVNRLARANSVSMPIAEQVYGIIHEGWDPVECVQRLLSREQKAESTH